MPAEIFRFMTIRPPQAASATAHHNTVEPLVITRSEFLSSLSEKKKAGSRDGMEKIATAFIARDEAFITSKRKVDPKLLAFHEAAHALDEPGFSARARDALARTVGVSAAATVDSAEFKKLRSDLTHSLVAAAIDPAVTAKVRGLLVGLARTVGLVMKLAKSNANDYARTEFYDQLIVLPEGLFPLPVSKQNVEAEEAADEDRRKKAAADREKVVALSEELAANKAAVSDLLTTYERGTFRPGRAVSRFEPSDAGVTAPGGFVLADGDVDRLSAGTRKVLDGAGIAGSIDVARAVSLIEKRSSEISTKLFARGNVSRHLVNIGTSFIPSDALVVRNPGFFDGPMVTLAPPGPCPPAPAATLSDEVTVPLWTTHGAARALGFADLMLVEQDLLRYELGEIAHVENVLVGEKRDREFRTATTTEMSTTTESERTEENTKDLATTERFELQIESEKAINESTNTQAGVTVSASYGPSVDVTANFNYASNTAKQASNRASSSFARDTTTKATSKIQTRTMERRFVRTVNEVEEKNSHSFENRANGATNIRGVYRFVDKIYNAQVVSYGKRFMLEFVVPEPAAFLRHAMTRQPAEGVTQIRPDPPGYCQNGTLVDLQPQDISAETYLFWSAKYLASDVVPPPSNTQIVSGVLVEEAPGTKSQFTDDVYGAAELKDLKIPSGYRPTKAIVTAEGWNVATSAPATLCIQIQKEIVVVQNQQTVTITLENEVTDRVALAVVTKNYERYAIVATVFCVITPEKYQEWQLATYASIMNAYNDLKTRFDNAMEAARMRASFATVSGTNPLANREREKIELRKACISLLTGQSFEVFDSVRRGGGTYGYPELSFADAEAEGRYIQFFENAFEWINMTYIFYPYFWGKKEFWLSTSQLADADPIYERFLQAGAARVQVPVRPGFEITLINFLGIRNVWFGDGALLSGDSDESDEDLYLSLLDELKEQLGNQDIAGKGRLAVTKDDVVVTGTDTVFVKDDEDKRVIIRGKTYVIGEVVSATQIRLVTKYGGDTETNVRYAIGPKLVGEPWEVKVPTNLVMINPDDSSLIIV